jgi:Flp pilus assembly protein TadG
MMKRAELTMSRRSDARRDEGATAVELALILPVVLAVLFFILYGALFFFYSAVADHVARSVARQVSVPVGQTGTSYPDASAGVVAADAKKTGGSLIPDPSTVTTTTLPASATPAEGDLVTVTVTYHLPVLSDLGHIIPGLSSITTITRSSTERRQ